ncbi:MAG: ABC transporter ATP-binding protein [Coleofasciculus sp. G1-WW12-02]|uniref:ABC transporter ATP-binding protein n=1 Tax=Coleofasciculus sp. G1-WW12-02 TaxID=3068483 RepID=UPI0032F27A9E
MFNYLSKFLYVLPSRKNSLIPLGFFFLVTPLLDTLGIGLIGPFIGLATNPESIHQNSNTFFLYQQFQLFFGLISINQFIIVIGLVIILVFYSKSALFLYSQRYIHRFGYGQQRKLRLKLMDSYLMAPYTFHLKTNTAILIHNTFNETNRFCNNIMIPLLQGVSELMVVCFIVALLANTDFLATATIAGLLLVVFLIYNQFKGKLVYFGKEFSESQSASIRIINHALGGFKETRVIGCEDYFVHQVDEQAQRYINAGISYSILQTVPRLLVEGSLITFLIGFTLVFVLSQTSRDLNSILGVFAVASIRLIPSVSKVIMATGALRNSKYTLEKLYFILKEIEQIKRQSFSPKFNTDDLLHYSVTNSQAISFFDQISLEKLTYRYPESQVANLENITLNIKKGQSIAFIGKSGAGKTTLVDVILGLLIPESGDIKVDGKSIYTNLRSWQNLVGYIPQSIFLIDDTFERNIAFGVPDDLIDEEQLTYAIQTAQLADLVEQLPQGIKTTLGERGVRLSGGQRQRVGIARALYHQREILVMDEATAALDTETETLVTEAIKSLSGTKTMLIIAHRLSTIEHCDQVYVLEQGRIVKSGSYQEVVLEEQDLPSSEGDLN